MACWYLYAVAADLGMVCEVGGAGVLHAGPAGVRPRPGWPRGARFSGRALGVYLIAASLALWRVSRTSSFAARQWRWLLPGGFWAVVAYTQAETLVNHLYAALAPSVVLLWVDLRSLGYLHAALRYVVVCTALPAALAAVLAPELRHLVASGLREEALRQTSAAVRSSLLVLGPVVLGLLVLAEDAMGISVPSFGSADVLRWAAPGILAAPVVLCGVAAAVSVGAFAAYLRGSIVYVVTAIGLVALLVPHWGLSGAAAAMTLGALVRQTAILVVLRHEGFRAPVRLHTAWLCAALVLAITLWLHPGRLAGAALLVLALGLFAVVGGVRPEEIRRFASLGLKGGLRGLGG
jgi:O-antigen/teichoic acid export membrane protein